MKQESKYEQVVHYLKEEIESGKLQTGSRLPSIRNSVKTSTAVKILCSVHFWSSDTRNTYTPNLKVAIMF